MVQHHKVDCPLKRLDCSVVVKVKVTGKVKNSSDCSSQRYFLNRWTFCNQTWYGDAPSWTRVLYKKIDLLFSSSGSQWGLIWSNYDSFCYIFWTIDSLAANLGLMTRHHMPECLVKKLDYCIQGQCHSKGSKCRYLSRWYFLNRRTFCYQSRYCDCWSFCYKTWFDGTLS